MNRIGCSLVDLSSQQTVWAGTLPARVELHDQDGNLTLRADFDRVGLVIPDDIAPTHRMVERWEIEAPTETSVRGEATVTFDGEKIIVDPNWTEPP